MSYIVKNPNQIPAGVVILSWRPPGKPEESKDWYEGDTFVAPDGMDVAHVKYWLESGFIEEK